jgi:hypothetical protein
MARLTTHSIGARLEGLSSTVLLAAILLILCGLTTDAQNNRAAVKIDEYSGELRYEDEIARLDNAVFTQLKKEPASRVYIIGYGLPGTARRHVMRAYLYSTNVRDVDAARVVPIVGGYRKQETVELWLVPDGAAPPSPSPPASSERETDAARKYDEFILQGEWFYYQKEPVLLDGFAERLNAESESLGYLVVHKMRGIRCEYCYFYGRELKYAAELKRYLVEKHKIAPSRIRIINRGYGESRMELWLVPQGASLPKSGR